VTVFELNNTFNTTSSGEGPAGTALTLILNASDGTFSNPVKRARRISSDFNVFKSELAGTSSEFRFVSKVDVLEFTRTEIGEFV
jgi:hypothetical protein